MIFLDTHVVVWLGLDPSRISRKAHETIARARASGTGVLVSGITLWEITFLHSRKRIHLDTELEDFLEDIEKRFTIVPISAKVCQAASRLTTGYPNDPVDRMIGASTLAEGAALVTADEPIRKARSFETIW